MIIRLAKAQDLAAIVNLTAACVAHMLAHGIEQWDEIYPGAENILSDIAAATLHVLCVDDAIIGCVTVDDHADPPWQNLVWSAPGEPFAAVHRLMIHPSQQGRGFAMKLMDHAETLARSRQCRAIRLDTFTQNPGALALYEKLGYCRTGTAMMRKGLFVGMEKLL
jgi:ribosomal protein S18 acetylase RimI-like enzyme